MHTNKQKQENRKTEKKGRGPHDKITWALQKKMLVPSNAALSDLKSIL